MQCHGVRILSIEKYRRAIIYDYFSTRSNRRAIFCAEFIGGQASLGMKLKG